MRRSACWAIALLAIAPVCVAQEPGQVKPGQVEIGKRAPDFSMTGIDGKEFKLSDKLGKDKHIVLMFSRAHW